jgi:hypothetical protein
LSVGGLAEATLEKRHLRHLQRRQHSGQVLQFSIVHAGAGVG